MNPSFSWGNPAGFLWLLAVPVAAGLAYGWHRLRARVAYPDAARLAGLRGQTLARQATWLLPLLRVLAVGCLALAAARPQRLTGREEVVSRGISLVLAIDVSQSMEAADFLPDRITAAREAAKAFVKSLPGHAIGLVVFAGRSFMQCPMTLDSEVVLNFLDQVDTGSVGFDGTAIGEGLLTSVARLEESKARSKVVVLLTDGRNNAGTDPRAAARIAKQKGIRVHTIGIGKKGGAQMMATDPTGVKRPVWIGQDWFGRAAMTFQRTGRPAMVEEPDDALLSEIAAATGGQFHRVTDGQKLADVYREIAAMQKDEVVRKRFDLAEELFPTLLAAALLLLLGESLARKALVWSPVA